MTNIEWTHRPGTKGESWNMIGGCTKVSPACDNCYALSMSWRLQNNPKRPSRYEGVVESTIRFDPPILYHEKQGRIKWSGRVNLDYDALEIPYRWKKPRTVFVASMADLFHEQVPDTFIIDAFVPMALCRDHTFLVLTKRANRMQRVLSGDGFIEELNTRCAVVCENKGWDDHWYWNGLEWPFPNVWAGTTIENQEQADKRIPLLLQTPAAVRWVSVEPMLGAVNMDVASLPDGYQYPPPPSEINWVVIGSESGPCRRYLTNFHIQNLIFQCDDAGVPVFVKQTHIAEDFRVSKDPSEWHESLRRREWPR